MEFKIITDLSALPQVIETNGEELKAWLTDKVQAYKAIVVTPDTVREAKEDKAKLTKLRAALEDAAEFAAMNVSTFDGAFGYGRPYTD